MCEEVHLARADAPSRLGHLGSWFHRKHSASIASLHPSTSADKQVGVVGTIVYSNREAWNLSTKLDAPDQRWTVGRAEGDMKGDRVISLEELEMHRSGDSVWVAVQGTVWE